MRILFGALMCLSLVGCYVGGGGELASTADAGDAADRADADDAGASGDGY